METTILNLCQKETIPKPSKILENPTVNDKNDFMIDIQNQKEKENVTLIIKIGRIYLITNLINNKKYVGITTQTLKQRWCNHTNRQIERRSVLHNSIRKYGKENFKMELIEELHNTTEKELLLKETFYINKYNTFIDNGCGYNLLKENTQKLIYSEFTRRKMSRNRIGEKNQFYGKFHTKETKQLMSKSHVGLHHTKESKKKISLALTREKSYRFNSKILHFKNINTNKEFIGVQYDFWRKYKFNRSSVRGIISGRRKSLHGWVLVNA